MSEEKAGSPSGKMGDEEKPVSRPSGARRAGGGSPWCPCCPTGQGRERKESARVCGVEELEGDDGAPGESEPSLGRNCIHTVGQGLAAPL